MKTDKLIFHLELDDLELMENDLSKIDIDQLNKIEKEQLRDDLIAIIGKGFWMPHLLLKYKSQSKLTESLKKVLPRILSDIVTPNISKLKKEKERIELNNKKYKEALERNKIAEFVYKNKEHFYTNDREFYCLLGTIEYGQVNLENLSDYCLTEEFKIPSIL